MTAQLIRLYHDMPQELCRFDLNAAVDAHVSAMRPTQADLDRAGDHLIEVQELRRKRPTQQQLLDAETINRTRRFKRTIISVVAIAIIAGLIIGHATSSAMTASIAADLAR